MNTKVMIAGITFKNPILTASGTFGSGEEYSQFVDLNRLGGIVTKGVANVPYQTRIIVNVCGRSVYDYLDVVERLNDQPIDMIEVNISCPNVKEGGMAFGQAPNMAAHITKEIRSKSTHPIIIKLSPNVTSIRDMAKAVEDAGADAISLINTVMGMKIDVKSRKFALANKTGGLSGPAIHPIAVRMVYEAAHAVSIPVIGMGGVMSAEDALELMLAGATAVAVGTANFTNPTATVDIINGICQIMVEEGIQDINEMIGAVHE